MQDRTLVPSSPPGSEYALTAATPARRRALISLTPLIDVVFILLVFFMLASSFLDWRAIDLNAPARTGGAAKTPQESILIEIQEQGLTVAGDAVTLDDLAARVREQLAEEPGRRVLIRPTKGVPLQRAVGVLDRLNAAGIGALSLVPDKPR